MKRLKADCPLGCECEFPGKDPTTKENVIFECPWFQPLPMVDTVTQQQVEEKRCAIAWAPFLLAEVARTNRSGAAATESLREETIKRQDSLGRLFSMIANKQQPQKITTVVQEETVLIPNGDNNEKK